MRGEVDGRLRHRDAGRVGEVGGSGRGPCRRAPARTRPASRRGRGRPPACSRRTAPRQRSRRGRRRRAARSMPLRSASTSASATASLSPKMRVFTASFMAAPRAERRRGGRSASPGDSRTGRARSRSAASPPTMIVSSPASVERDAARDRRIEDAGAARADGRRDGPDRVRAGPCSCRRRRTPARMPAATPSGPSNRSRTAASSATIEMTTSARAAASAGRGRRSPRRSARPSAAARSRRPVVDDDRDALAGQPLGHRRAHPARAEDGDRLPGHRRAALTRRRPGAAGPSRRSGRQRGPRGPRARPPTAAGCAGW